MSRSGLRSVVEDQRWNATIGWAVIVLLLLSAIGGVVTGDLIWAGFTAGVAALALYPPVRYRTPLAMLPWEVLVLAALPVIGRMLVAGLTIFGFTLTGRVATYFAVAAVALIIAVELDVFTPVRMTHRFAVFFVIIATMAASGVWAVVKWFADLYLGTSFYPPPSASEKAIHQAHEALMWDFVAATLVGVFAGVLFELYFRRRVRSAERLPQEPEGVA